ncbi:MAG: bifunctional diaminohydroxyphosphoribosylaminopyrimidine deaminase/5-amino-6-(5-phosphoribosylamino)uracil reductase RibD [Armatimonadota bacterium]
MTHKEFMKQALLLARRGRTSPNPMVGAVLVKDGAVVGKGYHPKAGMPHAEILALRQAGVRALGADLYVTLEPCCHHGKTPPCADAVIASGVKRVFAAMADPNPLVCGKGFERLRSAGAEVHVGLLEEAAQELNRGFIKRVTCGRPFVLWKAAMTLDGKTACHTGDSRWVTGESARRHVHRIRSLSDAVMVGIGTVLADNPQLTVRACRGQNPLRVVVDARAETPPSSRVLGDEAETIIAVTNSAPIGRVEALRGAGAGIIEVESQAGRVNLTLLLETLAGLGINNMLLESGGRLSASMLKSGLVDRGLIFIAPKIAGGRDAPTPVEGDGASLMAEALNTGTPKVRRFGDDIALEFDI